MSLFGVPTVLLVLYVLVFLLGLAIVPILAYTVAPSLGKALPEAIANMIFIASMLGVRRGALVQQETDEYKIERVSSDLGPRSYWTRWALAPFAITFEVSRQAFMPTVLDEEQEAAVKTIADTTDDGVVEADIDRGGRRWYINVREDIGEILVPLGERLSELENAADSKLSDQAFAEALKEYGGDTSDFGNRTMLMGTFLFTVLGCGVGWIVFF